MSGIPCALMRGGTSKGGIFLAEDLPTDPAARDDLLLRIMGSPDVRQIDGLGGAHPLTSKVGVVSVAGDDAADIDYLFLQVAVDRPVVSTSQTCGNILAAVAPFAIERGLVPARDGATVVRVRMVNTGTVAALTVRTPGGEVTYDGDAEISGVPGSAAPVEVAVEPAAGALLPTGNPIDTIAGVEATLIDNGMKSVLVRAADLGLEGGEDPAALEADPAVVRRVAEIRAAAFPLMGIDGTPETTTTPKIVLLSAPAAGGTVRTRSFIPFRVHEAIGVLGAASVAAGVRLAGTVADGLADMPADGAPMRVEHPTGFLDLHVDPVPGDPGAVGESRVIRTARMIMDGRVRPHTYPTTATEEPR
ncbi:PrpF domain-containing protein [Demequina sp. SYSU T00192]|uniref:PrpF domain-containing protein n=1 Tax=Demequina litoralis TaxID=3051660 RepID=A0ABT8G8Q3_9MICO|nr:PrpF domain-containing protein [Demequina sp. SYSU T00192]MDN4475526.1 PrpF domain-containing protein [Demequina sp. SYSU T00192]